MDGVNAFFFNYPTASTPITPYEMGNLWGLTVAHECGHLLGLVAPGNVLDGDTGWHNQNPVSLRVMNDGINDNLLDKLGHNGSCFWRLQNANYLNFLLPKQ